MKTKNTRLDPDFYADNAFENIQIINLEIKEKPRNHSLQEYWRKGNKKEREKINNVVTI